MEALVELFVVWTSVLVPLLAMWAIATIYMHKPNHPGIAVESLFLFVLLIVSAATLRTVVVNDGCWLVHSTSLSAMILAGVMRRPLDQSSDSLLIG